MLNFMHLHRIKVRFTKGANLVLTSMDANDPQTTDLCVQICPSDPQATDH